MSRGAPTFIALLMLATALAGCLGGDDDVGPGDAGPRSRHTQEPAITDDLFGWVLDPAFAPLPGVQLTVIGAEATAESNESGFYGIPRLPRQEEIIVIASLDGYLTQSKQLLLPIEGSMRLNFTLEPRPVKEGYVDVQDFAGLLACQSVIAIHTSHYAASDRGMQDDENETTKVDCGFLDPNNADHWEFSVGPDVAGIIFEAKWEEGSPFAHAFLMTVETTGFGAEDAVLAQVKGPSVLSAQVTSHQAQRFYAEGGIVRVDVQVDPNLEDEEQGIGVAFAYQQEFEILASVFYVDPAPTTYSAY